MRITTFLKYIHFILFFTLMIVSSGCAQSTNESTYLDKKVNEFLDKNQRNWRDMNVPYADGQVLFDLITNNNYTDALEIGTSTGHSTIWIAWAMSKTGGKVTTIEINESRHREALENIRQAGLEEYVDARLADAHQLVKELEGPFDFVFSDADKNWYTRYFQDVSPKLETGGCFTAHNVLNGYGGTEEFLDYVKGLDNYETTVNKASRSGISISFKRSE
jgi:predicted O-methyltransferase YrrM